MIHCRFAYLLLVLVATIGRILLQNKGVELRHREFLLLTHDDIIKEYCDGKHCVLIGENLCQSLVLTTDVTKEDLIGLIDKSSFVLPQKKSLWHKAITEYYNGQ